MQAFSHFTFERSGHQLIIVDIQGVGDLYTDPQIHTESGTDFGDGNLGKTSILFLELLAEYFFSSCCLLNSSYMAEQAGTSLRALETAGEPLLLVDFITGRFKTEVDCGLCLLAHT